MRMHFLMTEPAPLPDTHREKGVLLFSLSVVLLIIIAMVASFSFVFKSESRYQGNYAAGQRFAWLANAAHIYAQNQFHGPTASSVENLNLVTSMTIPDNMVFSDLGNTSFSIEIIGKNAAPVTTTVTGVPKAASAYLHLRIRTATGQPRAPNDTLAFQAGAASRGMARFGFYKTNIEPGDTCDGQSAAQIAVRWGPEPTNCLTDNQANAMFTNLQVGDAIAPAWETSLAHINRDILLRYPQPERVSYNAMTTDLNMGNNQIRNVDRAVAKTLSQTATNAVLNIQGDLNTTNGSTLNFNGPVNITMATPTQSVDISGTNISGNTLNVAGTNSNTFNNMSVVGAVRQGGSPLRVTVLNNPAASDIDPATGKRRPSFYAQTISNRQNSEVQLASRNGGAQTNLGVKQITGQLSQVETNNLAAAGLMDTTNTVMTSQTGALHIYAARLGTREDGAQINARNGWRVQSLEQRNSQALTFETINATSCNGLGCPNKPPNPEIEE